MNPWVVRYTHEGPAALRLLCFPHSGGGALSYRRWPQALPNAVDVCAVELPGHQSRFGEPLLDRVPAAADALFEGLTPLFDRPVALFGQSLGGLLAFEVARRMQTAGLPAPVLLAVTACSAPQLPPADAPLHHLSDDAFVDVLCSRYRGATASALADPDVRAMVLPIMRADMTMVESYVYAPAPPLACPIVAYRGDRDARNTVERLRPWQAQTSASLHVESLAGEHFFDDDAPLIASVRRHLFPDAVARPQGTSQQVRACPPS